MADHMLKSQQESGCWTQAGNVRLAMGSCSRSQTFKVTMRESGMISTQPSFQFRKTQCLLTQQIGLETLVYNEKNHAAFCLNPTASQVWGLLDGSRNVEQIAAAVSLALGERVSEEMVLFALSELRRDGLVEEEKVAGQAFAAPNRRDLIRRLGAGALVMLPAVAVIMAPKAAQAYNGCADCDAALEARHRREMIEQQQSSNR